MTNEIFDTVDWLNNQSSLNDSQAKVDLDGNGEMVYRREACQLLGNDLFDFARGQPQPGVAGAQVRRCKPLLT